MIAWIREQWERWKITIVYVGLVFSFVLTLHVNQVQNEKRVEQACQSIRQVRGAALGLTKPTSAQGVTDQTTLERIRVSNAAKADAKRKLAAALACRKN